MFVSECSATKNQQWRNMRGGGGGSEKHLSTPEQPKSEYNVLFTRCILYVAKLFIKHLDINVFALLCVIWMHEIFFIILKKYFHYFKETILFFVKIINIIFLRLLTYILLWIIWERFIPLFIKFKQCLRKKLKKKILFGYFKMFIKYLLE